MSQGTLTFFCGKMGAGKTTKSQELARRSGSILLSEDDWLTAIYPDEIISFNDYIKYSARLKPLLKGHVQSILNAGISVILDFPGNTKQQRAWFKEIFSAFNIPHKLIYIEADDELCLKQIEIRNKNHPERAQFDNETVFHQVTSYFQIPSEDEGFNIEVIRRKNT
ncbi:MAG: ATP-binding protein [Betaproteobacteria bacterium]|nr:ATP-binding protein [Betaproteobacteria bacterium]